MKRCICLIIILLSCACAFAEEADPSVVYEFARDYGAEEVARSMYESALEGSAQPWNDLLEWAKREIVSPMKSTLGEASGLIAPVLLLGLIRSGMSSPGGGGEGARFLLRLMLLLGFCELAQSSLEASGECIRSAKRFTDAVAPGVTALLTAMGMTGSSALVSPAASLAGGIAEGVFLNYGLPLCRLALCTAVAGNLSEAIDLNRFTQLLKKTANWGAGLLTTLFTALIAIQGNILETMDGVGVRTAKFAVDSASPVIGNGVSDAWESYISGMMIAKNALGVSGIAALLAAGLRPVILCAAAMLILNLTAALLELFGEREIARAAVQAGGICQMALSLAMAALVIATVLLGAAMVAGGTFIA